MQIELIVPFGVKTHGAMVAALNDVPGNAGNGQARSAGHGEESVATEGHCLLEITVICPRLFNYSNYFLLSQTRTALPAVAAP